MKKDEFDSFINRLCIECGIIDNRVVENVYNGLLRLVVKELQLYKKIELPDLGTFKKGINNKANIVRYNVNTGTKENVLSKSRLNFRINRKIRLLTKEFLD